jgi:hypothetical protein
MTNLDVFESKRECNNWLKELSEIQTLLVMDMLDEVREIGYNEGQKDAHSSFSDVCEQFGFK